MYTLEDIAKALGFTTPNRDPNRFHENLMALRQDGYNPKIVGDFVKIGAATLPRITLENEPYIIIAKMLESRLA